MDDCAKGCPLDGPTSQPVVPRQYQIEMFEASMKGNVIVTVWNPFAALRKYP